MENLFTILCDLFIVGLFMFGAYEVGFYAGQEDAKNKMKCKR